MNISAQDVINAIFHPDDTVCLRIFDDRKEGIFTGAKMSVEAGKFFAVESTLKEHNQKNHGIFFVVNSGGQTDDSIIRINAQFVEMGATFTFGERFMKNEEMALLFSEATPYIQKYHGKTLVIKYGGNAMVNEELKLAVMNDLVTLTLLGVRVVLVHGGGPAINQMLNRVGKESKFVNGLRYTDKETMSIVQQVLAGQVNKDLVALLKGRGVGLCGLDGHTITCSRKSDVDLGYVGNVEKVDTTLIEHLLNDGFIPVIATVGMDENGIAYNINADTAAAAIAIALHAEKFVSMTDIVGLLYDKDDESTLIPEVEISEIEGYKAHGVISGGMIPKIEGMADAIYEGVHEAVIIDGRVPHSVLLEMFSDRGSGTLFYRRGNR